MVPSESTRGDHDEPLRLESGNTPSLVITQSQGALGLSTARSNDEIERRAVALPRNELLYFNHRPGSSVHTHARDAPALKLSGKVVAGRLDGISQLPIILCVSVLWD